MREAIENGGLRMKLKDDVDNESAGAKKMIVLLRVMNQHNDAFYQGFLKRYLSFICQIPLGRHLKRRIV